MSSFDLICISVISLAFDRVPRREDQGKWLRMIWLRCCWCMRFCTSLWFCWTDSFYCSPEILDHIYRGVMRAVESRPLWGDRSWAMKEDLSYSHLVKVLRIQERTTTKARKVVCSWAGFFQVPFSYSQRHQFSAFPARATAEVPVLGFYSFYGWFS